MKLSFFYLVSALTLPLATVSFVATSCSKTEEIGPNLFRYENFNEEGDFNMIEGGTIRQYSFDTEWPTKIPEGDKFFPWLFSDYNGDNSFIPKPNNTTSVLINAKYFEKIINQLEQDFYLIKSNSSDSQAKPKTLSVKDINAKTIGINDWKNAELTYYYKNNQKSLSIKCINNTQKIQVDFSITNTSSQQPTLTPPPSTQNKK